MLSSLLPYSGLALATLAAAAPPRAEAPQARASSAKPGFEAARAVDGDPTTAWCAAENGQSDWWELDFAPTTVGAIHMKSGLFDDGRVAGHKIRDFVWEYQARGDQGWHEIRETRMQANRAQLILRFPAVREIVSLRLRIGARDPLEKKVIGSNNPCLREVALFEDTNARIETTPWFWAVGTWEDGGNVFAPLRHFGWPAFRVGASLVRQMSELTGRPDPDAVDDLWIGELSPDNHWLTAEPAPAAFLLSGNYKNYDEVDPGVYAGFYRFVRGEGLRYPMLGACGGHQLLAMAFTHPDFASFRTEFAPDTMDQTVITCSTNPAYGCGNRSAADCCYEGGAKHPFRHLAPNLPGLAMPNPYQSPRDDMLFNLLDPEGFQGYLYHSDYVDAAKIAPYFDVIATYTAEVAGLGAKFPTLVQAMKLKGHPIYGTQFHFDENESGHFWRSGGARDMDRVLRNFALIALDRLADPDAFDAQASSNQGDVGKLFDLDRASAWCSAGGRALETITIRFKDAVNLRSLVAVEGKTAAEARELLTQYDVSDDGHSWTSPVAHRESLYASQDSCGGRPGVEDRQSWLTTFERQVSARFLRLNLRSRDGAPICLRELMVLK